MRLLQSWLVLSLLYWIALLEAFLVVPPLHAPHGVSAIIASFSLHLQSSDADEHDDVDKNPHHIVDIAIVGAGLASLCAGAILNTCYNKTVGIYESHYLAGGCAHAFDVAGGFTFDAGPTILLGCSSTPYNALQQVLQAVGQPVEWIPYDGWGMIERPGRAGEKRWKVQLGPDHFEQGPLLKFGGETAVSEFRELQRLTQDLLVGATIPAMAMRAGPTAAVPLLFRYTSTLFQLIGQGDRLTGTFAPYMDGPIFTVENTCLRNWLDALAFSLSGLPANRTSAAAMGFVLNDMHRAGAALDYPKGGMGSIVDALVRGVEQGPNGSKVNLKCHVESIDCSADGSKITGLTLSKKGIRVHARQGVICNAPVWTLRKLIKDERVLQALNNQLPLQKYKMRSSWSTTAEGSSIKLEPADRPVAQDKAMTDNLLYKCDTSEMTASFLHLHLAINATGLDLSQMEAHYTVMDRGIEGDESAAVNHVPDGPCGELNMIAVSNPCVIDPTLAPKGYMVLHAYGAANEPYEIWQGMDRKSLEYTKLKEERAEVLWRAVESVIPDVRDRVVVKMIGSPITHERFLRRPRGSYGSATEDYLKDGSTPFNTLVIANDGVFPGTK